MPALRFVRVPHYVVVDQRNRHFYLEGDQIKFGRKDQAKRYRTLQGCLGRVRSLRLQGLDVQYQQGWGFTAVPKQRRPS